VNGGNLDIVFARDQSRVLRITRDAIEGLASCIDNYRVENVRFATDDLELDGWTLADDWGWVDKSGALRVGRR
jgi:hypothetical protein